MKIGTSAHGFAKWSLLAALLASGGGILHAQPNDEADTAPWRYSATLYGYFPSIRGDTTFPNGAAGPTLRIDAHTILSDLNAAFMGAFHAQKGVWGIYADWIYADVSDRVAGTRAFQHPGYPPADVTADFDLGSTTNILTLAGTRQLVSEPRGNLHFVFGVRRSEMRQTLDWRLSAAIPGTTELSGRAKAGETNWDVLVGLSGRRHFDRDPRWFALFHADAGTGDSKFTGQALAGIGYTFDWGEVAGTWRYIDYQFGSASRMSRTSFSGPAASATFRF